MNNEEAKQYFHDMMSYLEYIGFNDYLDIFDKNHIANEIGRITVKLYFSGMSYRAAALYHFSLMYEVFIEQMANMPIN